MIEVQSIMPNDKETAHVVASKIISTIKDFAESILTHKNELFSLVGEILRVYVFVTIDQVRIIMI